MPKKKKRICFLLKAELYSILFTYHTSFIHSVTDRHWGYIHLLAIMNNAAMNMGVQVPPWIPAFCSFGDISRRELLEHVQILCVTFWGTTTLCSTTLYRFTFPPAMDHDFSVSAPSPTLVISCCIFGNSHVSGCKVVSHRGLDFRISLLMKDSAWCLNFESSGSQTANPWVLLLGFLLP